METALIHLKTFVSLPLHAARRLAATGLFHGLRALASAALATLLVACSPSPDSPASGSGSVSGQVVSSSSGSPLAGVTVSAAGTTSAATTTTGSNGRYTLQGVNPGSAVVLKFSLSGYAPGYRSVNVAADATAAASARLSPVLSTQSIAAASGGTVGASGGVAQVALPANGLVNKATGAAASGQVTVEITAINPATDAANMPGGYAARGSDGSAQTIESFGALSVNLSDAAGNRLDLAAGQTATVRIPLGTRSSTPPATVPLYYFDETAGLWVQQGSAALGGTAPNQYYEGTVSHFTYWNADRPAETIFVHGCVKLANGSLSVGAQVNTDGVDYSGASAAVTDGNGNFVVAIRKGGVADLWAEDATGTSNVLVVGPSDTDIFLPSCMLLGPPGPPVIVQQPAAVSTQEGSFAQFQVVARGAQPLRFQWLRNGTPVTGALASSLLLNPVSGSDHGARYSVVVSNDFGSVTSDVVALTVAVQPPGLLSQPQDVAVTAGATASFSVSTQQPSNLLSLQWKRNGVAIANATGPSYTTPATTVANNGDLYSVTLSNSAGTVTSREALLTVQAAAPPVVTQNPAHASVTVGAGASFQVVASGSPPLSYQWQRNGTAIPGATSASYATPATVLADNGAQFTVVVSNAFGSTTSGAATLTVTNPSAAPSITAQPQAASVISGLTASFSVTATGTAPLSYQWQRNGVAIAGATASSYTTAVLAVSDSGAVFSVVVSNAVGSATSSGASLTVTAAQTGAGRYLVAQAGPTTATAFVYANGSQSVDSQAILAASAAAPTGTTPIEAAGQATALFGQVFGGTVAGGQVSGLHTRYALYFKAGRLYQIDHDPATGAPQGVLLSTLTPADVCASGGAPQLATQAGSDLVDASRSWVFFAAPVSGVCASPASSYRAVRMSMGSTSVAATTGEPVATIQDSTGAISGYVLRNGSTFQKVDANLANASTLFTLAPSAFKSLGVSFGATAPGVWLFFNGGQVFAYDLATQASAPTAVATLQAGEQLGSVISDGASAYVSLTSSGFSNPSYRILRVSDTLSATPVFSASAALSSFALTPTRIVMVTVSNPLSPTTTSLKAVQRDGSGLVDIGGANDGFFTVFAYTAAENVYLLEFGINGTGQQTGVRTRIMNSDGSNVQVLANTSIVGATPAASSPAVRTVAGSPYALLLIDNVGAGGTTTGGSLRSVVAATRAASLSYGTVQATPAASLFPASIDPMQFGLSGLLSFLPATGTASDLYFIDSGTANSLVKLTGFVSATGQASPAAVVRAPGSAGRKPRI
jgi:hypothetical protein